MLFRRKVKDFKQLSAAMQVKEREKMAMQDEYNLKVTIDNGLDLTDLTYQQLILLTNAIHKNGIICANLHFGGTTYTAGSFSKRVSNIDPETKLWQEAVPALVKLGYVEDDVAIQEYHWVTKMGYEYISEIGKKL